MYCTKCGTKLDEGSNFCIKCGTRVNSDPAAATSKNGNKVDTTQAKEKIFAHNNANPYVDITPLELKVGFPIVKYTGFFPQQEEAVIYAVPSATFKDKEQVSGYSGKSGGASVRVAKGVTVRTGHYGSQPIRNQVRRYNYGDLIITNKRVVFIGKDDSFDFSLNSISAIKPLSKETFVLQSGRSSKNIYVDPRAIIYTSGLVNYAITLHNEGLDYNAEKQQAENETTPEQRALCDRIRQEVSLMVPIKNSNNKKSRKGCFNFIVLAIFISIVAILFVNAFSYILGISSSESDTQTDITNNDTTEYVAPPLVTAIGKFSPSYATYEVGDVCTFTVRMKPHDLTLDDFIIENSDDSIISITNIAVSSEDDKTVLTFDVTSISVGKSSIKIIGADGKTESNALNVTVNEKDTSRIVYVTPYGEKYHLSSACAGSNATATTENKAKQSGRDRCNKCG